jgi:hypothetical protein
MVGASGLRLLQSLDGRLSPDSWDNVTRSLPGGRLEPASGSYWPLLLVRADRSVFTSACLPLHKAPRA